jgi:CBS domain-containing protein
MKVEQLMTKDPVTCRPQDSLNEAARIFWERDCGCVPVVENGSQVVGMLTDRDICIAAYIDSRPLSEIPASVAMAKVVHACSPQDSVRQAEEIMRRCKVRRLPVTDAGRLVGILSISDIALEAARERRKSNKEILDSEVGETIAVVSEHRPPRASIGVF